MSGYFEALLVVLAINTLAAYGAALPLSVGILNLGTAGFMAVGAYVSAYLTNEIGFAVGLGIAVGAFAAGVLALALGQMVLRTEGIYLALATVAMGQILSALFLNLDMVGGAAGYPVMNYVEAPSIFIVAVAVCGAMLLLGQTRLWLCWIAIKNDAVVSDLFGMNVRGFRLAALAGGAVIAGLAGGLYAHYFSYIEAQHFSTTLSIYTVLYVILGGTQTAWGPVVGALAFTFLPELFRPIAEWRFALFAVLIILFMVLRPEGLVTSHLLRRLRRPLAKRELA
jgi:branched-chain amino acid transport system permease protein